MSGSLLEVERALSEASDARQDLIGGLGPDEGGTPGVVRFDELVNGRFQGVDASMHAASQLLGSLSSANQRSMRLSQDA